MNENGVNIQITADDSQAKTTWDRMTRGFATSMTQMEREAQNAGKKINQSFEYPDKSLGQLRQNLKAVVGELETTAKTDPEFDEIAKQARDLANEIKEIEGALKPMNQEMGSMGERSSMGFNQAIGSVKSLMSNLFFLDRVLRLAGQAVQFVSDTFNDLLTRAGIMESMTDSVEAYKNAFLETSGVLDATRWIAEGFMEVLTYLNPIIFGVADAIGSFLTASLQELQIWLEQTIANSGLTREDLEALAGVIQTIVIQALNFLIGVLKVVITVIIEVIRFIKQFAQNFQEFVNFFATDAQRMVDSWANAGNSIIATAERIGQGIADAIVAGVNTAISAINSLIDAGGDVAKAVGIKKIAPVGKASVNLGRISAPNVGGVISSIGSGIAGGFSSAASSFSGMGMDVTPFAPSSGFGGGGGGRGGGGGGGKSAANKELEKQMAELERATAELERMKIEELDSEEARQIASLQYRAKAEIDAFKGTAEQKVDFERLVNIKLQRDVLAVQQTIYRPKIKS
jgi:hypothetical protein